MKNLKILISHNKLPHIHDLLTIQYKKMCVELGRKFELKIIWVIYPTEETSKLESETSDIVDASKYHNSVEILQEIRPDVVMINGSMDFHNITMALAARYMKISIVTVFFRNFLHVISTTRTKSIRARIGKSFANSKFYFKQYIFLIKTLRKINYNPFRLMKFTLFYIKNVFFSYFPINKIISGDINLCKDSNWTKKLIQSGFDKSTIFEVGDPYFDSLFDEIQNSDAKSITNTEKTKILFCTTTMFGHGLCSKKEESELIIDTINEILKHNDFEICLKIHPSTASIEYYEKEILPRLSSKIMLYQHENLIKLITQNDLMLTYGGTGSIHYGVLMRKPIINLDFKTNATGNNVFLHNKIITQCKSPSNLISDIQQSRNRIISEEAVQQYIKTYIGILDGKSSKRAAETIFNFLHKRNS